MRLIATSNAERAGELKGLEIAPERNAFAVLAQTFLVDCLDAEEHEFDAELFPEREHLFVPQQHVAACLQIVLLADALTRDRFADGKAVPVVDEGNIV